MASVPFWRHFVPYQSIALTQYQTVPPKNGITRVFRLFTSSFVLFVSTSIFVFYRPIMFSVVSVSLQEGVAMWPLPMMPLVCHVRAPRHVHNFPLGDPIFLLLPHRHLRPPPDLFKFIHLGTSIASTGERTVGLRLRGCLVRMPFLHGQNSWRQFPLTHFSTTTFVTSEPISKSRHCKTKPSLFSFQCVGKGAGDVETLP